MDFICFKAIADALMQAAMQTDYEVSVTRSKGEVSVTFATTENGEYKLELYGATKYFGRVEFRMLDKENAHIYMNQAEFISELQERFKEYGIDFNSIIERTAA